MFPRAEVKVLEVSTSENLPLFLELNKMVYVPRIKRFHFENFWVREDQCSRIVRDSWSEAMGWNIMEKMAYVSLKLEEWGGGMVKELRRRMNQCKADMQKFRSRRDRYGVQKYDDARDNYSRLLEKQEVYWKQRSKQFWLREGDQNSKFFHKYERGRKKQNQITRLKDSNDEWQESKEGIRQIIVEYFSGLFKSSEESEILSDRERVKQVSDMQNEELIMPVTTEEVKRAVISTHPDKSPGIDGLNPCFFQTY